MINKLIKLLGGYTKKELDEKETLTIKSTTLEYKVGEIYYKIKKDDTGFEEDKIEYVKILELSDIGLRYMPVYLQENGNFKNGSFVYDPSSKKIFNRRFKKYDTIFGIKQETY